MSRILMIVTAADSLQLSDGSSHPTGFWAEELVVAHQRLSSAGHSIRFATPGGAAAPVDPGSLLPSNTGGMTRSEELSSYLEGIADALAHPEALAGIDASDFDALVLPGGHGPMADLADDEDLGRLLTDADAAGTFIAPFCHGPAGLLSAIREDGTFVFTGRNLTVFTDEEERTGGTGAATPWFVATRLAERGAVLSNGPSWSSFVVRDGNLISGQNPQSSDAVADELLSALAGS
ncbi:type 1 glutamine amidotransferase domain-containing protein [Pseudoclavibacter terrae]|uniref:Type 1 glutamine amidotransferase domain-containing protein n=1 Tax=Pseudoclavibacter terrae TaxID=1530195 RepID=A0A7J5B2E6_9MICO|nr:type 1 glutamine amidotransferase domain-containing protein [Pseudoclavibacter terrae]KAB1638196.1 type 1 glutamine amidotransferase domain-containing protein [Pseudoclavibacter terrae]